MADVWMSVVLGFLKGVAFVCDVLTYIPWCLIDRPAQKLYLSQRIKVSQFSFNIIISLEYFYNIILRY